MLRTLAISALIFLSTMQICVAGLIAGEKSDPKMTADYLEKAQKGDIKAQFYLGALYSNGVGVTQSDTEAFRWFLSAAERGHSQARIIVGAMYAIGRGVGRSNVESYKWTSVAAMTSKTAEERDGARQLLEMLAGRMSTAELAEGKRLAQPFLSAALPPAPTKPPAGRTEPVAAARAYGAEYDRLTEAIDSSSQDADVFYKRGNILAQQREYELAGKDFSRAVELDPGHAQAFNNRCWTNMVLGQSQTAISDCDQALRLKPQYPDALDSRGLANLKLDHLDRAIADFDAALRLKPQLATSLYGRGIAHKRQGHRKAARSDMDTAIRINPDVQKELESYGIR